MTIAKLTAAAGVVLVAGCATNPDAPSFYQVLSEAADGNGRACVDQRDIRGYGVLDEGVISIDGRRNYYLATVMPGCNALESSPRALFEGNFSEVCGGGGDRLRTDDEHCSIRQIFEFEDREAAMKVHGEAVERYRALRDGEAEDQDEI